MIFHGFPTDVFQFYQDLSENNDRDWWAEHGYIYRDIVLPTMTHFIEDLDPEWWPMTIYRPYRNVRFSPDKTPYKTACGAVGSDEDGVLHYFQIGAAWVLQGLGPGARVSRGMYMFSWDQLQRYHEAIDADTGNDLQRRIDAVRAAGYDVGGYQRLVTAPKGYGRDHPRVELLRLGGLTVSYWWPPDHGWLRTRRAIHMVQDAWRAADPVTEWLGEHVGPPEM